ncbi:MAG: MerR family transcriptional regulator [Pseudomonadota bacterium]
MAAGTTNMQLKVGELTRRTGLTVRTLHHYDAIGLVKPSGRSESGYRLYGAEDVARLHGVQALRQLGMPLADIAALLDGAGSQPQAIVREQIKALDRQIAQSRELRTKLALIQEVLLEGKQPGTDDWLEALSLMGTFGKYFGAGELRAIMQGWTVVQDEWMALMARVRAAMDARLAPDAPAVQSLVRQWMAVVYRALDGDFRRIARWDEMFRNEPSAHGRRGAPPTDMIDYVRQAAQLRMQALARHFTQQELERFRPAPEEHWRAVQEEGSRLLLAGHAAGSTQARALAARWLGLLDGLVGHDPVLLRKLLHANAAEPLLAAGSPLDADLRAWLLASLDPHVT